VDSDVAPDSWAIADVDWSTALGLPQRPEGWGLVLMQEGDHRWTWAGDPIMVTAMEEREGDVPNWDQHFILEAEGWPETVPPTSGPHSMTWRTRRASV
jgi:hypothetical protein